MRTCGLSHQIKGPTTVKLAKTGFNWKIVKFTITGPLIWCDNPQVRLSKILYINNNDFHNLGRSYMCAGGCCYFRPSKPHSGTLCVIFSAGLTARQMNDDKCPASISRNYAGTHVTRSSWSAHYLAQLTNHREYRHPALLTTPTPPGMTQSTRTFWTY